MSKREEDRVDAVKDLAFADAAVTSAVVAVPLMAIGATATPTTRAGYLNLIAMECCQRFCCCQQRSNARPATLEGDLNLQRSHCANRPSGRKVVVLEHVAKISKWRLWVKLRSPSILNGLAPSLSQGVTSVAAKRDISQYICSL